MKKIILFGISFLLFFTLFACKKTTLTFLKSEVSVVVGDKVTLEYEVTEGKEVEFSISPTTVATISNNEVTGVAVGEATVTAKVKDEEITATMTVNVVAKPTVSVTSVNITGENSGVAGTNITLSAEVLPADATNKTVEWSSSDETIATVNSSGLVTLLKEGVVTITAKSGSKTDTHDITVTTAQVDVATVTISGAETGYVGDDVTLAVEVLPADATNKTVEWSSSDETIATVNSSGLVTLLKEGVVTITAESGSKTDTHDITVTAAPVAVETVTVSGAAFGAIKDSFTLSVEVLPADATNKTVEWSSSDETIATVNSSGLVTLLKEGVVTITAEADSKTATHNIAVYPIADLYVNSSWANLETVAMGDQVLTVGTDLFATIKDAVLLATQDSTIYVAAGTYTDDFSITTNGLTILGANFNIDPNNQVRQAETIISGVVTLSNDLEGFILNGLSFTAGARVVATGKLNDFLYINNILLDSTLEKAVYSPNTRAQVMAFISLYSGAGAEVLGNITITNSLFTNIKAEVINMDRTSTDKRVLIENNVFKNFAVGVIRFDGGYNAGTYDILNNTFRNDVIGGLTAITLRSFSPNGATTTQRINVIGNSFINIGDSSFDDSATTAIGYAAYNGILNTGTFNDGQTELNITNNYIDNCVNGFNINALGVPAGRLKVEVANNHFNNMIGYPSQNLFYNVRNGVTGDTSQIAIHDNYSDVDKFVNPLWDGSSPITVGGKELTLGTTAFSSIKDAVTAASENDRIYIFAGTYSDPFTISTNGLELFGPNFNIDPNSNTRSLDSEAIITSLVTIATATNGITFNGLYFTANASLVAPGTVDNFVYVYNVLDESTLATAEYRPNNRIDVSAFIRFFTGAGADVVGNVAITNNLFNDVDAEIISISRTTADKTILIKDNVFSNFSVGVIRFDGGYNAGTYDILNNIFRNDVQSGLTAISFRAYSPSSADVPQVINIVNNKFINIGDTLSTDTGYASFNGVLNTGTYNDGKTNLNISYNYVENCVNGFNINAANVPANRLAVVVNNNVFKNITGLGTTKYAVKYGVTGSTHTFYVYSNYCDQDGLVLGTNSYDNKTVESEVGTYNPNAEIVPLTAFELQNAISELPEGEHHDLTFGFTPSNASLKVLILTSSNPAVATIDGNGRISALKFGTTTITATSLFDPTLTTSFELAVTSSPRIDLVLDGVSVLEPLDTLQVLATVQNSLDSSLTWTSSDEAIATVDETGLITALANGEVTITATLDEDSSVFSSVKLTVLSKDTLNELTQLLIDAHNSTIISQNVTATGYEFVYNTAILGSVSNYSFATFGVIDRIIPTTNSNRPGTKMPSLQYIAVHDTGSASGGAAAHANFVTGSSATTSWHFTVGNEGIYRHLPLDEIAYHAGDGTANPFSLTDTGVVSTGPNPVITITDGYYYLNGQKSNIAVPNAGVTLTTAHINELGIRVEIGENNNYFMGNTWYTSSYGGKIVNYGGNMNSIGIETSIKQGEDLVKTWQMTASLVASLLIEYDLGLDRVKPHYFFNAKNCPQTMRDNDLFDEFLMMVEFEYHIQNLLADGYTISFVSNNPDLLDNYGRVINQAVLTTTVSYTVTVSKDDLNESVTLYTQIPGSILS